jgi:hypothetical protein
MGKLTILDADQVNRSEHSAIVANDQFLGERKVETPNLQEALGALVTQMS